METLEEQARFSNMGLAALIQELMDVEDKKKREKCLVSITMRLAKMSAGGGDLLMAYGKNPGEDGKKELARMGPDDKPIYWMGATAEEEMPEGLFEMAELIPVKVVTILDKLVSSPEIEAIVINPFSYDGSLFMINKEMANLALSMSQ